MKYHILILFLIMIVGVTTAGEVVKTFNFSTYTISTNGNYSQISFPGTTPGGLPGQPSLPYEAVSLILPPGEEAVSIDISGEDEKIIPGIFELYPMQLTVPYPETRLPFIRDGKVYLQNRKYPEISHGKLRTDYLNGFAFALSAFTPLIYDPATGSVSYYTKVTVTIQTVPSDASSKTMENLTFSPTKLSDVRKLAQNPEMMNKYPAKKVEESYQLLIITPQEFTVGFSELCNYYNTINLNNTIATTEEIIEGTPGADAAEKIRNYIIQEYQSHQIEYVLLGGDVEWIPYRGFFCEIGYVSNDIPADLYYAGLDGSWNNDNDERWGEPEESDLLPDLAIARMSFSNATEQAAMVHKDLYYQAYPVSDFWRRPYLVGEMMTEAPLTFGSDYLELLINQRNDNGYETSGIPAARNHIFRLYDTLISAPGTFYAWQYTDVLYGINQGRTFIHHCGHGTQTSMMRLYSGDITDQNFSMINGVDHNYTLMYSQGCFCGDFRYNDCIGELCMKINNFLAGAIFNSDYGFYNPGTTDGPSEHLHREFTSALYNDTLPECHLGAALSRSKIMSAPYVNIPGNEALRWCIYDGNALGDPAMIIWTDYPTVGITPLSQEAGISVSPNPNTGSFIIGSGEELTADISITNGFGQNIFHESNVRMGKNIPVRISLSDPQPGIYIVFIEANERKLTKKLIIR